MATFKGAETVRGGYYLNVRDGKLEVVEGASGVLPGDDVTRYARIPVVAMLVLAPLMGLLFVLLVPFLGVAVLIEQIWAKAYAAAAARRMRSERAVGLPPR